MILETLGATDALMSRAGSRVLLSEDSLSAGEEVIYIVVVIVLILISGLCAGLTLGLLSLDKLDLEVIKRTGTVQEKKLAKRVEPLLKAPHRLLVALLLTNSICVEALPIFLDRLLNPILAITISVTAILIFGEIAPQAVCKRYGLQVGAYLNWFVHICLIYSFPISWPLGKLLDWMLGEESVLFRRNELHALVTVHGEDAHADGNEALLNPDEVRIIQGALDLAHKTTELCMTPLSNVFSLSSDDVINRELLEKVIEKGHSRIPVYRAKDKKDIIGLILVKELVLIDETAGFTLGHCALRDVPRMRADLPLYSALKLFRSGHSHMALCTRFIDGSETSRENSSRGDNKAGMGHALLDPVHTDGVGTGVNGAVTLAHLPSKTHKGEQIVGIITIEDVLEELLQYEIIDETDRYVDNLQTVVRKLDHGHRPRALKFLTKTNIPTSNTLNGGTGNTAGGDTKGGGGGGATLVVPVVSNTTTGGGRPSQIDVTAVRQSSAPVPLPSAEALGAISIPSQQQQPQLVEVRVDMASSPPLTSLQPAMSTGNLSTTSTNTTTTTTTAAVNPSRRSFGALTGFLTRTSSTTTGQLPSVAASQTASTVPPGTAQPSTTTATAAGETATTVNKPTGGGSRPFKSVTTSASTQSLQKADASPEKRA